MRKRWKDISGRWNNTYQGPEESDTLKAGRSRVSSDWAKGKEQMVQTLSTQLRTGDFLPGAVRNFCKQRNDEVGFMF